MKDQICTPLVISADHANAVTTAPRSPITTTTTTTTATGYPSFLTSRLSCAAQRLPGLPVRGDPAARKQVTDLSEALPDRSEPRWSAAAWR